MRPSRFALEAEKHSFEDLLILSMIRKWPVCGQSPELHAAQSLRNTGVDDNQDEIEP